jgi:hypothetical protein
VVWGGGGGGVAGWFRGRCGVGFGVGVGWVSVGCGGCGFRGGWWVFFVDCGGLRWVVGVGLGGW